MELNPFIRKLEERLQKPLPGKQAQIKMTSLVRLQEMMNHFQPDHPIQSSVLVLFYPYQTELGLVLMLRPEYQGIHSGQISFPGGKFEDNDESLIYTALREAKEEVGIDPSRVQIIGQLTEMYIPPSNYLVTPVVGYMTSAPQFVADPKEVASIIEIRVSDLLSPYNIQKKKMNLRFGLSMKVPAFVIEGHVIWGATAMMLSELRDIILEITGS